MRLDHNSIGASSSSNFPVSTSAEDTSPLGGLLQAAGARFLHMVGSSNSQESTQASSASVQSSIDTQPPNSQEISNFFNSAATSTPDFSKYSK